MESLITAEHLRERLSYDSVTGVFRWLRPRKRVKPGAVAGAKQSKGYLRINIDGRSYLCHRLAWLHHYGKWPKWQIDHINGVKTDNRIENLRETDPTRNSWNVRRRRGKSRYNGVVRVRGKWVAHIRHFGKVLHIGTFASEMEAASAFDQRARELRGHLAVLNLDEWAA